jgi:hypothetical protein
MHHIPVFACRWLTLHRCCCVHIRRYLWNVSVAELLQGFCDAAEQQSKAVEVFDSSNDVALCNDLSDVDVQVQSTQEVRHHKYSYTHIAQISNLMSTHTHRCAALSINAVTHTHADGSIHRICFNICSPLQLDDDRNAAAELACAAQQCQLITADQRGGKKHLLCRSCNSSSS